MKNIIFGIILFLSVIMFLTCIQMENEYLDDLEMEEQYIPENDFALQTNKQ